MDPLLLASSGLWSILVILIVAVIRLLLKPKPPPWEKCGIYTIPKLSFFETLRVAFGKRDIHKIDLQRQEKHSNTYGVREGSIEMIVISDLDVLRKMFIDDFWIFSNRTIFKGGDPIYDLMLTELNGDEWKRLREILTPAFSSGKIRWMVPVMLKCADILVENLVQGVGKPTDVKKHFDLFTIQVIATTAFGLDVDNYPSKREDFILHGKKVFSQNFSWRFLIHVLLPKLATFLGISFVDSSASRFFKKVTLNVLKCRKEEEKTGVIRNDFLQILIDIEKETERREEEKDPENLEAEMDSPDSKKPKIKSLTKDEMIAQCVMFFAAGFATTSSTITLACHVLALHPEIQLRAREEVDAAAEAHKGKLTYEGISTLKYLDKVLLETLRMYPQAVRIMRKPSEDYTFGDSSYVAHRDVNVTVPIYAIHHDPTYYPDPEIFNPERFSPSEMGHRDSLAFMGFGIGPRNCIGKRFALMEAKICVASIIRKLVIKKGPKTQDSPKLYTGYGLLTPKDVELSFEKR